MGTLENRLYFGSYPVQEFEKIGLITQIKAFYFSIKKGLRLYVSIFDHNLTEVGFRSFQKTEHYKHVQGFAFKYANDTPYREQFNILPESVLKEKQCEKSFCIKDLQTWAGYKESILCADLVKNSLPKDMKTCIERLSSHDCPIPSDSELPLQKMNIFDPGICKTCEDICYANRIACCQFKKTKLIPIAKASKKCPRKKHTRTKPYNQLQLFT